MGISRNHCIGLLFALGSLATGVAAWHMQGHSDILWIDADHFDFGSVKVGQPVTHTFILRNETSRTLDFEGIARSCGCTTVTLSPDKHLSPHQAARATCVIDTKGYRRTVSPSFSIAYRLAGEDKTAVRTCYISGRVEASVTFSSDELAFLAGHSETKEILAHAPNGTSVLAVESDHPAFLAYINPSTSTIRVSFDSKKWEGGDVPARLVVSTSCESEKLITIPIHVKTQND